MWDVISISFRRLRGDMIDVLKIMHNLYDIELSPEPEWNEVSFRTGIGGYTLKTFNFKTGQTRQFYLTLKHH